MMTIDTKELVKKIQSRQKKSERKKRMSTKEKKLYVDLKVGNPQRLARFQMDTGATVNVLSEKDYCRKFHGKIENLHKTDTTLVMFNKTETKPLGKVNLNVVNLKTHENFKVTFLIVPGQCTPILGTMAILGMKLMSVNGDTVDMVNVITDDSDSKSSNVENGHSSDDDRIIDVEYDDLIKEYHDVFEGLGKLPGKLHLELKENAKPVILPARNVAVAEKERVKCELDRLEKLGVIAKVEEPTEWVSWMLAVPKANGKVRICLDPGPLNDSLKRNHYRMQTLEDVLPNLNNSSVFSTADAKDGFWHVELDEESSYLTTMGTPFGKYRWLRMPFGIAPAPEEFTRRLHSALECEKLDGIESVADDVLIHGSNKCEHDNAIRRLLSKCRKIGLKLNRDKFKMNMSEVKWMGHVISSQGLKPDPEKIRAITEMPTPTSKSDVSRFLGMVNYLLRYAENLSAKAKPLRELFKSDVFEWQSCHTESFEALKSLLTESPVLKYFDENSPVSLQCDASKDGLGACIMQNGQPVAYASRSMTTTETKYAQIEKELLSIVFGMERFHHLVYLRHVKVESDHKPLQVIFRKSLLSAPKRLQRMMLRLQNYDFTVEYKRGETMYMADTLSRAYISDSTSSNFERDLAYVKVLESKPICSDTMTKLRESTKNSEFLMNVIQYVTNGWPDKVNDKSMAEYFNCRDELVVENGLLIKGDRIVIPQSEKQFILNRLHASHASCERMLKRAKELAFWPKMRVDIERFVNDCSTCAKYSRRQQKEPLISTEIPSRPWQILSCDFFHLDDADYLVTVDHYSDYFEVDRVRSLQASEVIPKLKCHLARHGLPEKIITDNGPPFSSEKFAELAKVYQFNHVTSSPYHSQGNGKAENAVKIAKNLIRKCKDSNSDVFLGLLELRNIPSEFEFGSPVQRLYGRRTATKVPISDKLLKPELQVNVESKLRERKVKQKEYYDKHARDRDNSSLRIGQTVRIEPVCGRKEWKEGTVVSQVPNDSRSYEVQTDTSLIRRNRVNLKATQSQATSESVVEPPKSDHANQTESGCGMRRSSRLVKTTKKPEFVYASPNKVKND